MMKVRRAAERGHANHGWLDTYHTFSFADYYEPDHMGFRALRVINDDTVAPGRGFGTHGHRDMEIVSYVLDGALEHRDSMGTGSVLRRGDVQRMTAGAGVTHSEFNHSKEEALHFLQIWLLPERDGLTPGYEEKMFTEDDKRGRLRLIVSPDGRDESLSVHQDARIYASVVSGQDRLEYELAPCRYAWLQVARGELSVNGEPLQVGDGVAFSFSEERKLTIVGAPEGELLLFDLA